MPLGNAFRSFYPLTASPTLRMELSRRRFLVAGSMGLATAVGNACWIEPNRVTITQHVLGNPDPVHAALRMVQLTDLHLREISHHEEKVAETVHQLHPDLIVITGDAIDRRNLLATLGEFLALLPSEIPTYATLGNWEHWAGIDLERLASTYRSRGAQLLVNQSVQLEHTGRVLLLTGLDDATAGRPRIQVALAGVEPAANHLILAHSPVYREQMAFDARRRNVGVEMAEPSLDLNRYSPEYMLSGHTHGGQVQLLGWAPFRPLGSGDYVEGWYRESRPHLYVSRGVGTSILPIRCGAPPEVALFQWHLRAGALN